MNIPNVGVVSLSMMAAFGLLSAAPAHAQAQGGGNEPPRAAKVTEPVDPRADQRTLADEESTEDRYQPKGIEFGQFLLFPQIDTDIAYNSNVFASENEVRDDMLLTVRPEVKLRSRFARHQFNVAAEAEFVRYDTYTRDDVDNFRLISDAIIDVAKGSEITFFGEYSADHEERGSNDDARGIEPTPISSLVGRIGGKVQPGRWTLSLDGAVDRKGFDDVAVVGGPVVNNDDRDRTEVSATARVGYEFIPQYAFVVAATGNNRAYQDRLDDGGVNRDSDGYRLETGLGLDITDLVRGDVLVGYQRQDYEDRALSDPSGLSVRVVLNYSPSKLTLIVPSIERSIQETTISGASAQVRTQATVLVRHEYARNIILTAFGGYFWDDFDGIDANADSWELRGRATYAFNSWVYMAAEVTRKEKDSDIAGSSFNQTVASFRIGFRY